VLDSLELPPGVVNLVNGGREVVEGILDHPGIDAVSFVGSAPVAKIVYERSAKTGKRVQALGGAKNHMVVMPDAVVDKTVGGIIGSAFGAAGQRCMAGSVLVTVGAAHDRVMPALREATEALRVGDGLDEQIDVGPVVSRSACERIRGYVDRGEQEGATLVVDGRDASAGPLEGSFVGPTIIDDLAPQSDLVREEIFGPVLSVLRFADEDEAVRLANDTEYGLSGSIWTRDLGQALRVCRGVETGALSVNSHSSVRYWTPFGGMKQSGLGRELGPDAPLSFTDTKNVFISTDC
jgi:malonate-semialdehyde dehydrogenase (acetylating) / methylmalonate-semialdehyde dehydrogenase